MRKKPRKYKKNYKSNFTKVDSHIIQPEEYEELPELNDEMLAGGRLYRNGIPIDIASHIPEIRAKTNMTQKEFAETFCLPLDTLRKWEQGSRVPTGAAIALLTIIDRNPEAALNALRH